MINHTLPSHTLLGIRIQNADYKQVLDCLNNLFKNGNAGLYPIYSINPEILMQAQENDMFRSILNTSYIAIPDGIGIIWAGTYLGKKFKERITGVRLTHDLIASAIQKKLVIGIIGGKTGSAVKLAKQISNFKFQISNSQTSIRVWADQGPRLTVSSHNNEAFTKESDKTIQSWLTNKPAIQIGDESIRMHLQKTNLLIVGFGAPKQEYFISSLPRLLNNSSFRTPSRNLFNNVTIALAAGGSIDELSGIVPKTPKLLDDIGLKWLFRLIIEPKRVKRQLKILVFAKKILFEN